MFKKKAEVTVTPDNMFMSFARIFITIISIAFMGILTVSSLFSTTGMEIVPDENAVDSAVQRIMPGIETVVYYSDGIFGNIIWLLLCALICFLMMPLLKKVPIWLECIVVAAWTITLGFIWVYSSKSAPSEDSYWVTTAAWDFATDFWNIFNEGYFKNYSFQLGYVFFNECILRFVFRFFGKPENLLFLEALNVVFLAASYVAMIIINSLIFKDRRVHHITAFVLLFAAQPIIFCSFLYGIIPGMTFAIYGVLFLVLYIKKDRLIFGILSAVFTAMAVMIKSNNNIVLVAVLCIMFVMIFKRKKFIKDIIIMGLIAGLSLSIMPVIRSSYEKRGNTDLGDPIPYTLWFNLGLHEADNGPGWYNPYYTIFLYEGNGRDSKKASEEGFRQIKEQINYFYEHPQYRHDFFYRKFMSQWNETSYQSLWNNQVRYNYGERGKIAEWACTEGTNDVKYYMDIYAQLIFAAVLAGLFGCMKNRNFLSVTMPLIILGGMMYHILAEAKSQYAIPYFVLMMGFAGYGLCVANDYLAKKTKGHWLNIFFRSTPDIAPVAVPAAELTEAVEASEDAPEVEETADLENAENPEETENAEISDNTDNTDNTETEEVSENDNDDDVENAPENDDELESSSDEEKTE